MYLTWCAVPSVVASHLCLESGATERPVSLMKQVSTTGGVCVCMLWYYLNSNIWHHTVLLLNSIDNVFNHTPIHITDMHPFVLLNLFS